MSTKINRFVEIVRWLGIAVAIFFAFLWGTGAQEKFSIFAIISVLFIAGLTFIEGFFLSEGGSKVSGYGEGGAGYRRQSRMHFLALTLTMLVALFLGWGFFTYLGIYMVLLIFLTLSSINHLYTGLKEKMVFNTFLRPIITILLWIITLYFLMPALAH